jgi:hypothetical protein
VSDQSVHPSAAEVNPKAESRVRKQNGSKLGSYLATSITANRWDEKAGLRTGCCTLPSYRGAQSTDKKETGNEEG